MTATGADAARNDAVRGNLAALVCMLLWATNFPVADALLDTWSPLSLTAARLAIGGTVIAIAALAVRQWPTVARLIASPAVALAAMFQIASTLLFMIGQTKVDPVVAAVIVSSMPVITSIVGWLSGEERLTVRIGAAIALAVLGGVVTSWPGEGGGAEASLLGAAAILGGMISYVLYTNVLVSTLRHEPDIAKSAACMSVAAVMAAVLLALAAATGLAPVAADASPRSLALLAWLGAMAVGASTVFWLWAGRHVGLTVAAMHHNLVPFYVIMMGAWVGTPVTAQHVTGALMVIAGAVLAQVRLAALFSRRQA
jgi:drug/metabolite transporter (DMT)-like permease